MKTSLPALALTWLTLIGLTLAGAGLGDGASPGLILTLIVATITALKGGLVIEEFLEVAGATPGIRYPVRIFGLLVPVCMVLVYLYGPQIAQFTRLAGE